MIGKTISHYEIVEKLGEGGMGVVYKARDSKLDRDVALKFLPPHLSASDDDKARFIQEAKAAATLAHPNICTIFSIEEHESQLFIAMELVEGQLLRDKIEGMTQKQAIEAGIQIADGLAAAHEKGVVHRDVKPENIMIRRDGIAQIMDFGLAKLKGVSRLTKEGSTVGTAGYMSPEQVQGEEADHRSDIFSLGVLLYEMLSGQLPFKGVHETAVAYEIVNVDAAPIAAVKPEIDPTLDAIILECLEKDRNERTQAAKQVAIDLKRFKRESSRQRASRITAARPVMARESGPVTTGSTPERRFLWQAISGALFILVLILGGVMWFAPIGTGQGETIRFPLLLPNNEELVSGDGGTPLAISADGRRMFYRVFSGQQSLRGYLRDLDQIDPVVIEGMGSGTDVTFSPDGDWFAFWEAGKLKKVPVGGGAPQEICDVPSVTRGIYWARDGYLYYGQIGGPVARVASAGGTPQEITVLDSAAGELSHRNPILLPGGDAIVYSAKLNSISTFNDAPIKVKTIGGGQSRTVIPGGMFPKYSPTGHLLYTRNGSIYAAPFDDSSLEVTGPSVLVIEEGGGGNALSGASFWGLSEDGTLLYADGGQQEYAVLSLNHMDRSGKMTSLLAEPGAYVTALTSPDQERVVLNISAANDDIWVYDIPRETKTRLTFGGGNNFGPIWSADGEQVIYSTYVNGIPNLVRKRWDGSAEPEVLTNSTGPKLATSASPDGKHILYEKDGDLWILSLDDKDEQLFLGTEFLEYDGRFSPDGEYVAYVSDESGVEEVYVTRFPGAVGKWQISSDGGNFPAWPRDAGEIIYQAEDILMSVRVETDPAFTAGTPSVILTLENLVELDRRVNFLMDISPDGKQFIVSVLKEGRFRHRRLNVILGWFDELEALSRD